MIFYIFMYLSNALIFTIRKEIVPQSTIESYFLHVEMVPWVNLQNSSNIIMGIKRKWTWASSWPGETLI